MYKQLKQFDRLNETVFLGSFSVLCLSFSVFRFVYSDTKSFLFLNWNLFLAFLPWLFSTILVIYPNLQRSKLISNRIDPFMVVVFPKFTLYFNGFISPGIIPIHADLV